MLVASRLQKPMQSFRIYGGSRALSVHSALPNCIHQCLYISMDIDGSIGTRGCQPRPLDFRLGMEGEDDSCLDMRTIKTFSHG